MATATDTAQSLPRSSRRKRNSAPSHPPVRFTLLQLVEAVSEITENDAEVVQTVVHMLETGSVRLQGNFRGAPSSIFSK